MTEIKQLECLVCGNNFPIPTFINVENYDGQVVCQNCASLLHLKLVQSKVRQYRVVEEGFGKLTAEENFQTLEEAERKFGKIKESPRGAKPLF